jgi:glycosyltransferase involved in cell wall biosynthesis
LIVAGDICHHGGMDRANLELARFLATRYPVHLVTHRVDPQLAALPNVTVHQVPRPWGRHLLGEPLLASAGRAWAKRLSREGFRVVVNGGNCCWPDINWVHMVHAAAQRLPTSRGLWGLIDRISRRKAQRDERRSLRVARLILCNSHMVARQLCERLAVPANIVHTVYCGVDPIQFSATSGDERRDARRQLGWPDRLTAVFVGVPGWLKGFDTLYAAWQRLWRSSSWDVDLVVVGTARVLPHWQRQAEADGLGAHIRFLGFRTDVPTILAASDLLVHPARYEAYGLCVQEALCRGVPAIISSACGISERYPPELQDLILQNPEDVDELVERLRQWRANPENVSRRIQPFSEYLRSHSWADMAREIHDLALAHS